MTEPQNPTASWTPDDDQQASSEGWSIFEAVDLTKSDRGKMQLQRIDETEVFDDDSAAWLHVYRRAAEGSELHRKALAYLKEVNLVEYAAILLTGCGGDETTVVGRLANPDELQITLRRLLEEGRTPGEIYKALVEVAPEDSRATSEEVTAALRRDHTGDEINIDTPTMASRADDGVWVHAWLWVPNSELKEG